MLDKLELVMIVVSDMQRSVRFYRDVLGLSLEFESTEWTQFRVGATGIGLHPASPHLEAKPGGISIGFAVSDLDATLEELKSRGAKNVTTHQEDFGVIGIVTDPDGYMVQLVQRR